MASPFSTQTSRGELDRPVQQEGLSHNSWNHIDVESVIFDRHRKEDGSNVYGLSRDGDHYLDTDILMTGEGVRHNLLITSASSTLYGSHFAFENGTFCHTQQRRSSTPCFWSGDDDENMSDGEEGGSLRLATYRSCLEGVKGSYKDSHDDAEIVYEESDENRSTLSEKSVVEHTAAQDLNEDETLVAPPPHPYFNTIGLTTLPWQLQFVHGSIPTMGTEAPPAVWSENNWSADDLNSPVVDASLGDVVDIPHPVQVSNSSSIVPVSENLGLIDFLHHWAYQGGYVQSPRSHPPRLHQVMKQEEAVAKEIHYSDLKGNECDFQGLNWQVMETTRTAARLRRHQTYKNYVNRQGSDSLTMHVDRGMLPQYESFFRFRRMNIRQDVHLSHFQLRSLLACPSRTHAYFPSPTGINRFNTVSRINDTVMSTRDFPTMGGAISTLDAGCGILMAGTFNGDYYMKSLDCDDQTRFSEGQITSDVHSGITNHIKIYEPRRSHRPVAAIASNDSGFRVMDIDTEQILSEAKYGFALNSAALSPDHRLRVLVGDDSAVLVTNADTGEVLRKLSGHRDYGFACDWSEDGWTVATGFQDRCVKIWDARRWCNSSGVSTPLCTIRSEMASVRSLQFSPLGSGRPVLVAAEEADFINLIDAQTWASKQTLDVFGEIGGVAFANDGQDLHVLCCDSHRGGLLELERCGRRAEPLLESSWPRSLPQSQHESAQVGSRWSSSRRPTLVGETLPVF